MPAVPGSYQKQSSSFIDDICNRSRDSASGRSTASSGSGSHWSLSQLKRRLSQTLLRPFGVGGGGGCRSSSVSHSCENGVHVEATDENSNNNHDELDGARFLAVAARKSKSAITLQEAIPELSERFEDEFYLSSAVSNVSCSVTSGTSVVRRSLRRVRCCGQELHPAAHMFGEVPDHGRSRVSVCNQKRTKPHQLPFLPS